MTDLLPLIRLPHSWPTWAVATVAMLALAALDLLGAVAAKEWAEQRTTGWVITGVVAFLALFWVYTSALQYGELALLTVGWIVVLQVGLLILDRLRYGVELPTGKWVAVVVIMVAQGYLVLAPAADGRGSGAATEAATEVSATVGR